MAYYLEKLSPTRHFLIMSLFALSTLTVFDLGFFSLSFIFGFTLILISLRSFKDYFYPAGLSRFLLIFIFVAFIGLLVADNPFSIDFAKKGIQLLYWFLLAVFVYNVYDILDKKILSKVVLVFLLLFIILDITFLPMSQNGVAFTTIIMGPLGFYYLKRYSYKLLFAISLFILMLFNGSRTGAVLSFCQIILFFFLFTPKLNRYSKLMLLIFVLLLGTLNLKPARIALGNLISPINERVGSMLINPEEVFRNDMSWLQRKAQVNKGLQIFNEHPLLGIGIFNFPSYNIEINISDIETDRGGIRNIENRSAHNTYIALLAETGILGLTIIISMFVFALLPFIRNLNLIGETFEGAIFISFCGLLAYFFLISGFFGTSVWLIYGLILGASRNLKGLTKNQ